MPGYVDKALIRFNHPRPSKPQHQPHPHLPIVYGAKKQTSQPEDTSPKLNKEQTKFVQEVTGVFLYYARAVDSTMLVALSAIAAEQGNPTENTLAKVKQFLDYAATHPEAVVTYKKSNMVLAVHSDASYLSEPKARSRVGGHFFMSANSTDPANNGAVLNVSKVIKAVMSSAAEAELGGLFYNAKIAVPMRKTLEELGHPQPPTPVYKQTIRLHMESSITKYNQRQQKLWICVFTGLKIEKVWNNLNITGNLGKQTWPIIGPNITRHCITRV